MLPRFLAGAAMIGAMTVNAAQPVTQSCNSTFTQGRVSVTADSTEQLVDLLAIIRDPLRDPGVYTRLLEPSAGSSPPGARSGFLQYEPVQDTVEIADRLSADPVLRSRGLVYANGGLGYACFGVLPPPARMVLTEYYNRALDHYFLSSTAAENAAIDSGAAGPGWERTGEALHTVAADPCQGASPVFRFYGPAARSHFFTVDPKECGLVRNRDPGWKYEGDAFGAQAPVAGSCPVRTTPVYRLYNNRWMFNDSNHRFVTRVELYNAMQDQGWVGEGIAMCLLH